MTMHERTENPINLFTFTVRVQPFIWWNPHILYWMFFERVGFNTECINQRITMCYFMWNAKLKMKHIKRKNAWWKRRNIFFLKNHFKYIMVLNVKRSCKTLQVKRFGQKLKLELK